MKERRGQEKRRENVVEIAIAHHFRVLTDPDFSLEKNLAILTKSCANNMDDSFIAVNFLEIICFSYFSFSPLSSSARKRKKKKEREKERERKERNGKKKETERRKKERKRRKRSCNTVVCSEKFFRSLSFFLSHTY